MQNWVREKLKRVAALFPADRLDRSRTRWERLWRGEPPADRYPFVYAPLTFNYYDAHHTPEERLRASLDEFILRGHLADDFIPTLFPGCRASTIPGMFGAPEIIVDDDVSCERLIHHASDIARLPAPAITPGSVAQGWLDMQAYFMEETEGRLPIHVADMQGPADVCGKLWGYEDLLVAAYTDPDAYHALMDRATDAFIMFWERQHNLLGELMVGTHLWAWSWVPPNTGAALSADSLVMVSPEFYREFYQPYVERIGERFGGVAIHSCGNFSAVIPTLCQTPHIRAVNTSQMTVPEVLEAGFDPNVALIAFTDMAGVEEAFALAHRHRLRLDLTIAREWPVDAGNVLKPLDAWSAEEKEESRRDHERILEAAGS